MLDVKDLSVSRDDRVIFDRLSITVATGERVAIHGPSGCGKTTLLHAIAGLVPVKSGSVFVDDVDLTHVAAHRRGLGLVFQDDQLFPQFDVGENIAYAMRLKGVRRLERARLAEYWLERVGLAGYARRNVDTLSGGQARRVALARTLAASPRVVMLDEPLSGIDESLHDRLLVDLRVLFDELRTTVLLVTHDRSEGAALCHRSVEFADLLS